MSYSTAVYRLQRQILFSMAQELRRDKCFRCGKLIECIEEFSVEHKKPWLDVAPSLFWDLGNVAFSHHKCNSGVARRTDAVRDAAGGRNSKVKNAPADKAWCAGHQDYVAVKNFHSNKRNASGYASYCKKCRHYGYEAGVGL